jgi:hypothetical protein
LSYDFVIDVEVADGTVGFELEVTVDREIIMVL